MEFSAPDAVDKIFTAWSASQGYQHPLMDGIIVDEFGGGDGIEYDVYRQVVERLNAAFKPKIYIPYGGRFYRGDRSTKFAQAALDGGGYVCPEYYLIEQPSKSQAEQFIYDSLVSDMLRWEQGMPGVIPRVLVVLGYMSQPTESLNVNPSANFKVCMDVQMRALATHPSCFGLGGLQWYHSSYCDEENVRWAGRLYRHYAIEGNTQPLTNDPYILTHLRNPDFAAGVKGWTIAAAEPSSVTAGAHAGYSWLQGRYPRTNLGDTFLLMKRCANKPNVFSQEIRDLTPGRLYSLKMITADHQDLVQEKSDKKPNAVSIRLDNVELSTDPKQNFQFTPRGRSIAGATRPGDGRFRCHPPGHQTGRQSPPARRIRRVAENSTGTRSVPARPVWRPRPQRYSCPPAATPGFRSRAAQGFGPDAAQPGHPG